VRALYPESAGWRLVACPISKSLANQNARGEGVDAVAPEILIVRNADPRAGSLGAEGES
jgi:hypothetical protein